MNILWLAWKDTGHPGAGGAEIVLWELSKRMVAEGHQVTWLTCGYEGASKTEIHKGIRIIRVGTSRYLHSFQALAHYIKHMRNKYDVVIETVNTAPYFGVFFGKQSKRFLFYHQLAREVWYHEAKAPLNHLGYYVIEPVATRLLSLSNVPAITVSNSTSNDLKRHGFGKNPMHIISEGIEIKPVKDIKAVEKYTKPTLLSLGSLRAMKRTLDQIVAFEAAKQHIPALQLKIAGASIDDYGQQVIQRIKDSPYAKDIEYLGKVSTSQKIDLMQRSHALLVTSIKEGWGLVVTEAASQGTPSVVYDVDGLRDSVRHGKTGLITQEATPASMAQAINKLLNDNSNTYYDKLRDAAWQWSKQLTFDQSYSDLKRAIQMDGA